MGGRGGGKKGTENTLMEKLLITPKSRFPLKRKSRNYPHQDRQALFHVSDCLEFESAVSRGFTILYIKFNIIFFHLTHTKWHICMDKTLFYFQK